ncbi:MAG: hypothetical protein MUC94_00835 [bacterium]|nr:hypothetical protein [bacterium]
MRIIITGGSDCHDRIQRPLGVEGMTKEELDVMIEKINLQSKTKNI